MSEKRRILRELREELEAWEALFATLGEAAIVAPRPPDGQSVKDVVAHLRAWQQVSLARLEAARAGGEPAMPVWLEGGDPEDEAEREAYNARIAAAARDLPWPAVHAAWRAGFLRLLELGEATPEDELLERGRHPWLKGYALFDVLQGSYWHHHDDHLAPLRA